MKTAHAAILFVFMLAASNANAQDPYKQDVEKLQYDNLRANYIRYIEGVKVYYFAYGCKVFNSDGGFLRAVNENQFKFINRIVEYEKLMKDTRLAAQVGLEKSKTGCGVFKINPSLVIELRRYGQAGIMP